jgi:predicted DCC family thiol-disulfide oxidoreductase YuxK
MDAKPLQPAPVGSSVIFVDGECVICHRIVSFILAHDPKGLFRFGHLQGELARAVLARHGREAADVDSVYLVTGLGTESEQLSWEGRAGREIWPRLFFVAHLLRWIPLPILDWGYRVFARNRYRLFGKYDACHVPTLEERTRFIELGPTANVA